MRFDQMQYHAVTLMKLPYFTNSFRWQLVLWRICRNGSVVAAE